MSLAGSSLTDPLVGLSQDSLFLAGSSLDGLFDDVFRTAIDTPERHCAFRPENTVCAFRR